MERLTENGLVSREEIVAKNCEWEDVISWYDRLTQLENLEGEFGLKFEELCNLLKKNKQLLYYNKELKEWRIKEIFEQTTFPAGESNDNKRIH